MVDSLAKQIFFWRLHRCGACLRLPFVGHEVAKLLRISRIPSILLVIVANGGLNFLVRHRLLFRILFGLTHHICQRLQLLLLSLIFLLLDGCVIVDDFLFFLFDLLADRLFSRVVSNGRFQLLDRRFFAIVST